MSISHSNFKIFSAIFKFAILLFILIGIPLYIYFCHHEILEVFSDIESTQAMFEEYKGESIAVYLCAQIIQIVICFIPGQWLQFAAGYMYGFWFAYLLSFIGAAIGTIITYYLAKLLGSDMLHLIFGEENIKQNLRRLNSKKAVVLVFLIYLIPGIPKDFCSYVAGISEMKFKLFLIISLIGRSPGIMGSILIGCSVEVGRYTMAGIIGGVALILFILGIVFRKKIHYFLDKTYDKLIKEN